MAETATALLRRAEALKSRDSQARTMLQEIAEFVRPHRSNITRENTEGQKQTEKLFDATAGWASGMLAASLHGTLTPSTQPWLSYELRDDELMQIKSVQDWLEDCAKRTYKALRQSNFNTSVHEMYLDLTDFGQGAIFLEEKPPSAGGAFGGLRFLCVPVGSYCVGEDFDGRVDTIFRWFKISASVAFQKWGDKIGEVLTQKAKEKPDELVEFMHAVYPRAMYDSGRRDAKNMPWASCYVACQPKIKVEEGGFLEFPFCVPRWMKTSGEVNGRGPSHTALPDVKSLNESKRIVLEGAPLQMQPPSVERDEAVIGDFDRSAGARIRVENFGDRPVTDAVAFLDTKTRPDMSQFVVTDLRQSIKEMYYIPQLQLPTSGPQMTATEVQVHYEDMQRILGPTTGRLESEFLNLFAERTFKLMARARAFRPMPQELAQAVKANAADLDIKYEGPMARAQRVIELTAQDRVVSFAMNFAAAEGKTDALDVLNRDKMIRNRAFITGLPADELRSEEEVQEIRGERADQQAKAAQLEGVTQVATAAGKAAPAIQALQPQQGKAA